MSCLGGERWHLTGCGSENGPLGVCVRVRMGWGLETQLDYNPMDVNPLGGLCPAPVGLDFKVK